MKAKKPLTHNEAVAEVYRITPQLREYDEFMYLGVRWLPYTMFFHHKNYKSEVINTDAFGFRYTHDQNERYSMEQFPVDKPVNLIIGGSTALGTGTTSDRYTVPSALSDYTREIWLNLGGRGYNATQELILFLMHQHRFTKINRVILLSGANTLTLEGLPDHLACEHGRYYYSYEFQHYMEAYNTDLRRRKNSYASLTGKTGNSLLHKAKEYFKKLIHDENPTEIILSDENVDINQRILRAAWVTTNTLKQWKQLLAPFGAELSYVLQPISSWTKDQFTSEEDDMFYAIDCCANNFWRLFGKLCAKDLHHLYRDAIERECIKMEIPFIDMNDALKKSAIINETFFVDHLHFNDAGYIEVARLIYEELIKKSKE
ncbi:SGNH/GDSL hydrolase family protein [Legionella sp. km535]|uniref:SGNH/GDSL hydrolase family protein n=1 Tax=Legionella sp. km535 TaxID=2498107 RepID=UPI000F8E18FF|nr:SGNH/GDSL hydrolase family protein [Legionella sp. km535]RUR15309.1 SGNH/GDSL hydrolase family protein [Legionella sp. km535]